MGCQGGQSRNSRNGFREISECLRTKITGGDLVAGSYLPTERELQIDFGASRTTIRKALAALIESGWAQNVPNRGVVATRGFKPGTSRSIGFVHSGSYVSQLLLNHLCTWLEPHGLTLLPIGGRFDYPMARGLKRAIEHECLAAIVWPNEGFPNIDSISEISRQLPIVAVDHTIPGISTDLVTFDYEKAAFDATEQLIRQGARRIGVTGMMDMLDITHQRFKGYLRALFAYDLRPDAADFLFTLTSGSEESNTRVLEQVFQTGNHPDAFFVLNDICLPSVVTAALSANIEIPSQLKLSTVGDDIDLAVGSTRMTAVAFDWEDLAASAVKLLIQRLDDLNRPPQTFVVPHQLRVRGLCGASPEHWTSDSPSILGQSGKSPVPRIHYSFRSQWDFESSSHQSRSGEILI